MTFGFNNLLTGVCSCPRWDLSGNASLRMRFLVAVLFCALFVIPIENATAQQSKQRPRRVTGADAPVPNNANDEVDEGDVVRVDTQLVSVPAVVTNGSGRPMSNLRAENFLLYEDGKPQTLANFATTQTPFEIALLLDTSGSTRADVALIRQAANAFIDALRPGDRVSVVAFDTANSGTDRIAKVELLTRLTDDRKTLRKAIDALGSSNGTPFYDALELIANQVFRDPPSDELRGRRAIVALTDGVDSTSDQDFATARARLLRAGIACYFVQVNTEDFVEDRLLKDCQDDGRLSLSAKQLARYRQIFVPGARREDFVDFCGMGPFERMSISRNLYNLARREMDELAKATGGRNFAAATLRDARAAFALVANEIGTQYSLGYYPTNKTRDGKYRVIKVVLKNTSEKGEVRARDGYFAPKG